MDSLARTMLSILFSVATSDCCRSAVVTNGIHPGPLITATKGDQFKLNVINNLTDPTMLRGTSIVSPTRRPTLSFSDLLRGTPSIGTGYSRRARLGLMVLWA